MLQVGVDDREETESLKEVEAIASRSINKSIICWKALFRYTCGLANTVTPKCPKCSHGNASRNDRVAINMRSGRDPVENPKKQ